MLRPPHIDDTSLNAEPERIMALGSFGTGKTSGWLNIAKWSVRSGSDARFFVMDSDRAAGRMLNAPEYQAVREVVTVRNVMEWPEYHAAVDDYLKTARPHDWLISDFVGTSWSVVQEEYSNRIFKSDLDDYFLSAREANAKGNPIDGWVDWPIINKMYAKWANKVFYKNPGNLYCTAIADVVRETDSKEVKRDFGRAGVKPRGQKHLGFAVHTILHLQQLKTDEIYVTTLKDRERPGLEGVRLNEFTLDYLVKVAGWKL